MSHMSMTMMAAFHMYLQGLGLTEVLGHAESELDETAPTHIQITGERSAIRIPNAGDEENFICGTPDNIMMYGIKHDVLLSEGLLNK